MTITLNLIPPQQKKKLKLFQVYIYLKNIIFITLIGAILIAIILSLAKIILQNNFNKTINQTYLTVGINKFYNFEIKEFNQELKQVAEIQKQYIPYLNFILSFTDLVPQEVTFQKLNLNDKSILQIKGLADTRDDLLNFKNNLEKSNLFDNFTIPLENLLEKENVEFELNLKLFLEQIKNSDL